MSVISDRASYLMDELKVQRAHKPPQIEKKYQTCSKCQGSGKAIQKANARITDISDCKTCAGTGTEKIVRVIQ